MQYSDDVTCENHVNQGCIAVFEDCDKNLQFLQKKTKNVIFLSQKVLHFPFQLNGI